MTTQEFIEKRKGELWVLRIEPRITSDTALGQALKAAVDEKKRTIITYTEAK